MEPCYNAFCFIYKVWFHFFLDIDECESYTDSCHEYATCTNTEGSYSCTCDAGFRGDGISCEGNYEIASFLNKQFSISLFSLLPDCADCELDVSQ